MEAYPRFFARFKVLCDPMFPRLADFLYAPRTVIDIGTGYGVPAVWLLELFPDASVLASSLMHDRVRICRAALLAGAAAVQVGRAPDIPDVPEPADARSA